ncbi:MAG: phosphate ABC transporter substrate-binding/OmpA family protein [Pseudomonadota bacterium]
MRRLLVALCTTASVVITSSPIKAEPATLTSQTGGLVLEGEILGFDGEIYRIDTVYGVLTVDGAGVACAGEGCPEPEDYVSDFMISGAAESGALLMPALLEAFAEKQGYRITRREEDATHFTYLLDGADGRPAAQVRFRVTSSDEGFADLLAEQADIALSFREITAREQTMAREAGLGDLARPERSGIVALDALVPIVALENPLTSISIEELAALFSGETGDWAALGAPLGPVTVHARTPSAGLSETFARRVLTPREMAMSPDAILHDSPADLADAVATDPFAIGITTFSERGNARALPIRGRCGHQAWASRNTLKTEDYPLTAPHFVYTPARRLPPVARAFLAYLKTDDAQRAIRDAGFVEQLLAEIPLSFQGDRLAKAVLNTGAEVGARDLRRLVSALEGGRRSTLTFRFAEGGVELDAQSRANVALLAGAMADGAFDGRTVLFAGFSDGQGDATSNRRLSLRRAEAVRDAVIDAADPAVLDVVTIAAEGFGEAMPMACDEDAWGRFVNRRVEIWLRPDAP